VHTRWSPQAGSQKAFVELEGVFESLIAGNRGGGKTTGLLFDFCRGVGLGFGAKWRGILWRCEYQDLEDAIEKSLEIVPFVYPGARLVRSPNPVWRFPTGEKLLFRAGKKESDYWGFHGHEYPWLGWEELCNWADPGLYLRMFSCCRSSVPGMPYRVRATTNPLGPGHSWVKRRFELPVPPDSMFGPLIRERDPRDGNPLPPRVAIRSDLSENKIMLDADPNYRDRIRASAASKAEADAWLDGSWDIVAGGMFDDVWSRCRDSVVVEPFEIPRSWSLDRSFDWGSAKPFSVGWWAASDGSDYFDATGQRRSTVRGDLFRFAEWYGSTGRPNEGLRMVARDIAAGIVEREVRMGVRGRVRRGPADSSIFDQDPATNTSIAREMAQPVKIGGRPYPGVQWARADKGPGSRIQGWQELRSRMLSAVVPREHRGVFVMSNCVDFLRTVPVLPRDSRKPDDVDTNAEDHIADEVRYRLRVAKRVARVSRTRGMA
jgi:hypothetical protein